MANGRFLDRTTELERLEKAWVTASRGQPQLVVIWGRRRVGMTFLLTHFVRRKRAVFFAATQQAEGIELGRLAEAVRRDLGEQVADLAGGGFSSWEAALRFFVAVAATEPMILVIDEAPYLARSTPGFPSIVQTVWDQVRRGTKLLLVLTGSAVGAIDSMLGAGGPLRGRPTDALRLDPLDPWSARLFLPRLDPVRFLEAYAACGGYPLHLAAWDPEETTGRNLEHLTGAAGALLLEDAAGILREDLPEHGGYARILAAIGRGRTRYAEIAGEAGQRVEHALDVLVRSGLVAKVAHRGATSGEKDLCAGGRLSRVLVPRPLLRRGSYRGWSGFSRAAPGAAALASSPRSGVRRHGPSSRAPAGAPRRDAGRAGGRALVGHLQRGLRGRRARPAWQPDRPHRGGQVAGRSAGRP